MSRTFFYYENIPSDLEIEDMELTENIVKKLTKLVNSEQSVQKHIDSLANGLKESTSDLEQYMAQQNEAVRLFIQLCNRESELASKSDLQFLKDHVEKLTRRIKVQERIQVAFKELALGYKEYTKNMEEISKIYGKLNKAQQNWFNVSGTYSKVKNNPKTTGKKLDKFEQKIIAGKDEVKRKYKLWGNRRGYIEQANDALNEDWQKLKKNIAKLDW